MESGGEEGDEAAGVVVDDEKRYLRTDGIAFGRDGTFGRYDERVNDGDEGASSGTAAGPAPTEPGLVVLPLRVCEGFEVITPVDCAVPWGCLSASV